MTQTPHWKAKPHRADYDEMRARIIAAAWELMSDRGLEQLTLNGVARQAACARSSVYRYFDSKEQLLEVVLTDRVYALRQEISATISRYHDPAEQVVQGLYHTVVAVKRGPSLALFRAIASDQDGEIANTLMGLTPEMAAELLSDPIFIGAHESGLIRDDLSDKDILQWLITIAISLVQQSAFGVNTEEDLAYLRRMLIPSIFKPTGPNGSPAEQPA